jgi:hypothetical protein
LRKEAESSRLESIQSNERLLNQIGQDLHDGSANNSSEASEQVRSKLDMTELLAGALVEFRNIAKGLVLPQLDGLATEDTLRLAVRHHEKATATKSGVTLEICRSGR